MTDTQEAKLSMYLAVKDFLSASTTIVTALPNFNGFLTTFLSTVDQIQTIRTQQENNRTGLAANKKQLRADMAAQAVDVARKLKAVATIAGNAALLAEVNYSISDFTHGADTIARDRALVIHQKSIANLLALAPYGITAAILANLLLSINAFNAAIPTPQTGINTRKQSTTKLKELFITADKLLTVKMDVLVETLRITNLDFYLAYSQSRKINNDHPSQKIAFTGTIIDKNSKAPLALVKVEDKDAGISKKTTLKGNFNLQNLAAGTYNIKLSKNGYKELTQIIYVNDGETTKLIAEMEPVS